MQHKTKTKSTRRSSKSVQPCEMVLDKAHEAVDIFGSEISRHVWEEKYRYAGETSPRESIIRVVDGVYAKDPDEVAKEQCFLAMHRGLWIPAGRIHAGAGTKNQVTLLNCYVDRVIHDSMEGIADALKDAMLTMQQGGGIGMDFSTLRPFGALLKRTGAVASGPLPFMDMWDSMCSTIMSAGSRRGAMMGTMYCEHPDLPSFIQAKHQPGRLTNFNLSVLVTDGFMDAVANDQQWYLGFDVPRHDENHLFTVDREDGDTWYVYSEWRARDLWDLIIKSTYEYSEPGVIFIDRVNDRNNLRYLEKIQCTNPCGEQPLPPNGACNLGAVNLARMIKDPFTNAAIVDFDLLAEVVHVGVRFLDNVIDITNYPLKSQKDEELSKRRIGLGITGLGNALAELQIRYGSEAALSVTNAIMERIKNEAYQASANLAKERGAFPLFDITGWGINSPPVNSLPQRATQDIINDGIRNGTLLTIAPTGTTSLYFGNVSSGLEPVYAFQAERKVRQFDDQHKEFDVVDYGWLLYQSVHPGSSLPEYMVTSQDLAVRDHVRMQAVCQKHVDASISKTINCPKNFAFEDFKLVYWDAYELDCKGCTTFRPSDTRGQVIQDAEAPELPKRPEVLGGKTYKVRWPSTDAAYYITINDFEGRPREMFISSTSAKYSDWQTALSLMVSAILRKGDDPAFIPEELKKVVSMTDYAWVDGEFYGSLVALIGRIFERHLSGDTILNDNEEHVTGIVKSNGVPGEICPKCSYPTYYASEGCKACTNCGYSTCD